MLKNPYMYDLFDANPLPAANCRLKSINQSIYCKQKISSDQLWTEISDQLLQTKILTLWQMNQKIVFFWNWSKSLMQKASSMDVVQKRFIWKFFLPEEESSLSWTVAPPSKKLTWSLAHSTKKPSQKLNRALDPNIDPAAATEKFMLTRFVVVSSNKAIANKWNLDWSRCNLQTARLAIILILKILVWILPSFFRSKSWWIWS